MPTRVDAFTHIIPEAFHDELVSVHPTAAADRLYFQQLYDVELRLADMDEQGVDRQVLTLGNPPLWRGIDPEDALPLVELANDMVAEVAADHPDRFIPVATLPCAGAAFRAEFDRAIDDLGMAGVQIFSNVEGQPIDSPDFQALYDRAADADVPVWIHPQLHDWYPWLPDYALHTTFGWPFDTTVAMGRLVFSGVFERHPDLAIITHHLGGMVPYFIGRVATFFEARMNNPDLYPDFEAPDFSTSIREQFANFYGDTVIGGNVPTLECGRAHFGDDHVLFASDYPFGPKGGRTFVDQAIDVVESVEDDDAREAMFHGNLEKML